MIQPQRVQLASRFLKSLSSTGLSGAMSHERVSQLSDQDLIRYAAELGYELDTASVAEAFRLRMLARELARRSRSTRSLQSR